MKWAIVSDSSADIKHLDNLNAETKYESVPFTITINETTYIDDEAVDVTQLLDAMEESKTPPSTACPSPHQFLNAFQNAENIICFTISSGLSGSYNSAIIAQNELLEQHPNANIFVMDTRTASTEISLLIRKTVELINQNLDFEQVKADIIEYHRHTKINYILSSTDNLVKNGRMNKLLGTMIGALGIKLIGNRSDEGVIQLAARAKGVNKSVSTVITSMEKDGYIGGKVEIAHSLAEDFADKIKTALQAKYPQSDVLILKTSGLCSFYAQRGGIILGYETK